MSSFRKLIRRIILFVVCLPFIFFLFCLTIHKAFATEPLTNDGPILKIEVSCKYVSLYTVKSDTAVTAQRKIFPKGSVLSISGDSERSEPTSIYVTVNQQEEALYKEPIKLMAKGRHTLKIRALDKDNNETSFSITYLVVE